MSATQTRYRLRFTQSPLLYVAIAFAVLGTLVAPSTGLRVASIGFGLLTLFALLFQMRARPSLVLDPSGYAVEEHGKEKLRVAWSEVISIRADEGEHALYVDCGDPKRNLLVPPRRGYGFRFENAEALYAYVLACAPDRIVRVERLDLGKA